MLLPHTKKALKLWGSVELHGDILESFSEFKQRDDSIESTS